MLKFDLVNHGHAPHNPHDLPAGVVQNSAGLITEAAFDEKNAKGEALGSKPTQEQAEAIADELDASGAAVNKLAAQHQLRPPVRPPRRNIERWIDPAECPAAEPAIQPQDVVEAPLGALSAIARPHLPVAVNALAHVLPEDAEGTIINAAARVLNAHQARMVA